jgi:glutamate dehydrogenase/leucine dehydrogenase
VLCISEIIEGMDLNIALSGARAIVEGIGEVGGNAIKILLSKGTRICGISDITGALYNKNGLEAGSLNRLIDSKATIKEMLQDFKNAEFNELSSSLLTKEADILLLAGPGRSITEENAKALKVKLIAEGANIAYKTAKAREIVNNRKIISIPGIIANSGGVISSYEEWVLENENIMHIDITEKWERVKASIDKRIKKNIKELCLKLKNNPELTTYECAILMAEERTEHMNNENKKLRELTKEINGELQEKFAVFTK